MCSISGRRSRVPKTPRAAREHAVRVKSLRPVHVISLGCCAIAAQTLFVREMMALFSGTEFVLGVLMAGWLLWIGLGGLTLSRLALRAGRPAPTVFARLAFLAAVVVPLTIVLVRLGRGALATQIGRAHV